MDPIDSTPDFIPDTQRDPSLGTRAALAFLVSKLGADEQRVLVRIAERLMHGGTVYGPLVLTRDTRDFRSREAREEIEDALVYFACAWLKSQEVAT